MFWSKKKDVIDEEAIALNFVKNAPEEKRKLLAKNVIKTLDADTITELTLFKLEQAQSLTYIDGIRKLIANLLRIFSIDDKRRFVRDFFEKDIEIQLEERYQKYFKQEFRKREETEIEKIKKDLNYYSTENMKIREELKGRQSELRDLEKIKVMKQEAEEGKRAVERSKEKALEELKFQIIEQQKENWRAMTLYEMTKDPSKKVSIHIETLGIESVNNVEEKVAKVVENKVSETFNRCLLAYQNRGRY